MPDDRRDPYARVAAIHADRLGDGYEVILIDRDGRVLATLAGVLDADWSTADDDGSPDALDFTVLPAGAVRPDQDSDPDAYDDAYPEWQRPRPERDAASAAAVPGDAGDGGDGGHDRERPFTHAHEHVHRAHRVLTHSHPHTHAKRERVAGEFRGGDHHADLADLGARPADS